MSPLQLAVSFFKIGVVGFGGGSALIPVIHNEIVLGRNSMTEDEYLKHTVIANITPGTLPVKLGATCGYRLGGCGGSVASSYLAAIPGVLATILILALFSMMGPRAIHYLNYASIGITVFIVFLLMHYVLKTVGHGDARGNLLLCLGAFLLTSGKEVREIVEVLFGMEPHTLGVPLFDIPMIHVMVLSFFLIALFLRARGGRGILAAGSALALAYALAAGRLMGGWEHAGWAKAVLCAGFAACLLAGPRGSGGSGGGVGGVGGRRRITLEQPVLTVSLFYLLSPVAPLLIGHALGVFPPLGECCRFLLDVLVSSVTSFGGGEAYVAVADSMFVQTGYCNPEYFYTRILPVANALPGPILVKIAAAIGFAWTEEFSFAGGLLMAATCTMLSIGACCALAMLVLNYYEAVKDSQFVLSLKRYILPVICGTLASTSLSMLYESVKVAGKYGISAHSAAAAMIAGIVAVFLVNAKCRLHDLILLGGCIAVSLAVMLGTVS